MAKFKHVDGCTVCQGLYEHFTLPDGSQVHYYHDDRLCEVVTESGVPPPESPTKLADLFHDALPNMPRLGAPPPHLVPDAHVPTLPPPARPQKHELPVKEHVHPDPGHRCGEYGYLPSANRLQFQLIMKPKSVEISATKQAEEKKFDVRVAPSVFRFRLTEAAAKDVYDTRRVENRAFRVDWGRVVGKKRFLRYLAKADCDEEEVKRVRGVMKEYYGLVSDSFDYYAAKGLGPDAFSMNFLTYYDFISDCGIVDKNCRRQDVEVVFTVANIEEDAKSAESAANQDRALCRFELLEALIRLADTKYRKPQIASSLSDALRMLCELCIKPVLEPLGHTVDSNVFREEHLYLYGWHGILRGDVNEVFLKHYPVLKALHGYYCQFKHGSRQPLMSLKEWDKMLKDADMFDEDFTRQEAVFAFVFSKMQVVDELKHQLRNTTLTLTDFLEALARVADMTSMPTLADMAKVNAEDAFQYFKKVAVTDGVCT